MAIAYKLSRRELEQNSTDSRGQRMLTRKIALYFQYCLSVGVFHCVRCMEMKMLLDDIKQVLAVRVGNFLTAREAHPRTMHLQKRFAAEEFDVEAVSGDREHFFAKDKGLCVLRYELVKYGDRFGNWCVLMRGHDCGVGAKLWIAQDTANSAGSYSNISTTMAAAGLLI